MPAYEHRMQRLRLGHTFIVCFAVLDTSWKDEIYFDPRRVQLG